MPSTAAARASSFRVTTEVRAPPIEPDSVPTITPPSEVPST